jgi:hypothetical protein
MDSKLPVQHVLLSNHPSNYLLNTVPGTLAAYPISFIMISMRRLLEAKKPTGALKQIIVNLYGTVPYQQPQWRMEKS